MEETAIKSQSGVVTTPDNMIMKALENDASMENLEKLLALKERVDKENARKAFKAAFAEFQANKPDLIKAKKVDFTTKTGFRVNYNFLPLPKLQRAIDPVLAKFGLSYRWEQTLENNKITITCILSHLDGHEERTALSSNPDDSGNKNSIQSIGSAVSYLKRYTLEAATGISSDEDDDGKSAIREEKKLPELTPSSPKWKAVVDAIKADQITIEQLKQKKFTLSEENENKLKEELAK